MDFPNSRGGEAGVAAGGGDGALGCVHGGATRQCRAMASMVHARYAAVAACVNYHQRSSTMGAVSELWLCPWWDG